ncbi:MAG: (2Fe-2S)-binding protein [Myxococcales bacterium]|nr:(2Fe-2S)-binding protein [Myxococcales bacterium]
MNDEQIRQCVRDGCHSARAVSRSCKAGSGCGGCMPLVKLVVKDELQREEAAAGGVELLMPLAQPA